MIESQQIVLGFMTDLGRAKILTRGKFIPALETGVTRFCTSRDKDYDFRPTRMDHETPNQEVLHP